MSRARVLMTALLVAAGTLVTVPSQAAAGLVHPFLDCVEESADGTELTGHFRAVSLEPTGVDVLYGPDNIFDPMPPIRDQPTHFPQGEVGFEVTFPVNSYAQWTLVGTTVRADADSPRCPRGVERIVAQPSVFGALAVGQRVAVGGEQAKLNYEDYAVSYQWLRGCDEDAPAVVGDQRTYDVAADDLGHRLQARVTYTSTATASALLMSTPCDETAVVGAAPAAQTVPHVTGSVIVGSTLALAGGSWSGTEPATESIRWESCDGASCRAEGTDPTYTTGPADLGRSVRAVVTRTNAFGAASVTTSGVGPVVPQPQLPLPPTGTLAPSSLTFDATRVGAATGLSAVYVNDDWAPIRLASVRVTGEHAADFALGAGSCAAGTVVAVGESCVLAVRFTPGAPGERRATIELDDGSSRVVPLRGLAGAAPASTVPPVVAGEPRVGSEVSVGGGEWTGTDPIATTVSWEGCDATGCHPVGSGPAYAPTAADVGKGLRAVVSASNAYGTDVVRTAVVGPVRPAPSGVVSVSAHRLHLGVTAVGRTGRAHLLRISNAGDAPLEASVRMTGRHRAEFRWSSDCGPEVALKPGEACTVTIRLRPERPGRKVAKLLVTSTAEPARTEAVRLLGRGVRRGR